MSFPGPGEDSPGATSLLHWLLSMSGIMTCPGRVLFASGLFLLVSAWSVSALAGQELPLKRNLPGSDSITCPPVDLTVQVSDAEKGEAARLGSGADQETMVGNDERANELYARATGLDPLSAELAYRYAISLQAAGDSDAAIGQFCRALGLGSREQGIGDAQVQINALVRAREPEIPEAARTEFMNGLLQADLGQWAAAASAFGTAFLAAPDWADAIFNRGVANARIDARDDAIADLQQYLALLPNAPDANDVSQRIGQLQAPPAAPMSGGTAFGVGLLVPGMGQFYSGRALGGASVLTLAAGALAAGLLIEEVQVSCVGTTSSGGECPPDRVISEESSKPYLVPALAAYGVITIIGAIEAYARVPTGSLLEGEEALGLDLGDARLSGLSVSASRSRLNLNLVRITF